MRWGGGNPCLSCNGSKMIKPEKPPVMFSLYGDVGEDLGAEADWRMEGSWSRKRGVRVCVCVGA